MSEEVEIDGLELPDETEDESADFEVPRLPQYRSFLLSEKYFQKVLDAGAEPLGGLRAIVAHCEARGHIEWLETTLKDISAKVAIKAEAHRQAKALEQKSNEERIAVIRGWLAKQFNEMVKSARTSGAHKVRTQLRRQLSLNGTEWDSDDVSYGVTISRRNGEQVYYVANIYRPPDSYKLHPIEQWVFQGRSSYCGFDMGVACDQLARRILGFALNTNLSDADIYSLIHGKQVYV